VGRIRPSGLLIVEYSTLGTNALLVGTVSGVFLSWTDDQMSGIWSRVGLFTDLPLVMVYHLSYEVYSDTLVCATFGRGIYLLRHAKSLILKARQQQLQGSCTTGSFNPPLSTGFFPSQDSC